MSIKDALHEFQTHNNKIKESLNRLREEVKKEGSYKIQRYMLNDQFEDAQNIMKLLEEFVGIELKSNSDEISHTIQTLFNDSISNERDTPIPSTKKEPETEEGLSFIEREIIEEIGYTSVSKIEEMKTHATKSNIQRLAEKGYIRYDVVKFGTDEFYDFELTEKGKLYFRNEYGMDAKTQKQTQQETKNDAVITIWSVEQKLVQTGYSIVSRNEDMLEIEVDGKSCYVLVANPRIESQMNTYYEKKNVAFICKSEQEKQNVMVQTRNWVEENKTKSKFLTVNFATYDNITPNVLTTFESVRFK